MVLNKGPRTRIVFSEAWIIPIWDCFFRVLKKGPRTGIVFSESWKLVPRLEFPLQSPGKRSNPSENPRPGIVSSDSWKMVQKPGLSFRSPDKWFKEFNSQDGSIALKDYSESWNMVQGLGCLFRVMKKGSLSENAFLESWNMVQWHRMSFHGPEKLPKHWECLFKALEKCSRAQNVLPALSES